MSLIPERGSFQILRGIFHWPVFRDMSGAQRSVVLTMLAAASWAERKVKIGGKWVTLPEGSFVASQDKIAEESGVGRQVVRTVTDKLSANPTANPILRKELTSGETVYTLCNLKQFRQAEDEANQRFEQELTNGWLALEEQPEKAPVISASLPQPTPGYQFSLNIPGCSEPESERANQRSIYKNKKEESNARVCDPLTTTTTPPSSSTIRPGKKKHRSRSKRPGTALLQTYYDLYLSRFNEAPQISWSTKDLKVAEQLLKGPPQRTVQELEPDLEDYFELTDPKLHEAGYPFVLFPYRLNEIHARRRRRKTPQRNLRSLGDPNS